ncbi:MAG: hypothetical protein M5R40_07400 [Anaerolineae bacterium]|nr:hypothetical protein [Anaerolineae bacterium]
MDCLLELSRQGRAHLWLFFRDRSLPRSCVVLRGAHALPAWTWTAWRCSPRATGSARTGGATRPGCRWACTASARPDAVRLLRPLAGREVPARGRRSWGGSRRSPTRPLPRWSRWRARAGTRTAPGHVAIGAAERQSVTRRCASGVIAQLNAALLARYGSLAGVVSQFTDAPDARGWTRCPFHEDERPSLRVDERHCRAVCYVCAPQSQRLRFATFDAFEFVTQARFGGDKKVATHVLAEELFAPAAAQ